MKRMTLNSMASRSAITGMMTNPAAGPNATVGKNPVSRIREGNHAAGREVIVKAGGEPGKAIR